MSRRIIWRVILKKVFVQTVLIGLIVVSSCSSLKHSAIADNQVSLKINNLNLLNGCYNRFPIDSNWGEARDLHKLVSLKLFDFDYKDEYVRLVVIDETHIRFDLIDLDSVVYSKILKGKLKSGEFEFRRRSRILPIIVATIYSDSKFRVGVLNNGNLIIDAKCMDYGLTYFILPIWGGDEKYDQEFERIKKP